MSMPPLSTATSVATNGASPLRLGFFVHPLPYGLYTVFRNLRPGLASRGIDIRWIGLGADAVQAAADPAWASEHPYGQVVAATRDGDASQARAIAQHLEQNFDAVLLSPPYHVLETNLLRYLPSRILRFLSVQSMSRGIYRPITAIRDWAHLAIASSPRVHDDLIRHSGFSPQRVLTIANGIDPGPYVSLPSRASPPPLRLLYLGRIENNQKGIFGLASLMRHLRDVDVRLTIAGDGPDLAELKSRLHDFSDRVNFAGVVPTGNVPRLLAEHHALILLSRSEGLPNVLLEAMAAGCVPVVARIRGLTDWAVEHGKSGIIFGQGDSKGAAGELASLAKSPDLLQMLSRGARQRFHERFTALTMAEAYADAIASVVQKPPAVADPLPMEKWEYPTALGPTLAQRLVPRRVKNLILRWMA